MLAAVLIAAPAADAQDRYALAGGCYGLKSIANGKFAAKTADGAYKAQADQAGAERFHLQATDLGRYLLFAKAGDFLANGTPLPVDDVFDPETEEGSLQSRVTIATIAGQTYYIQAGGFGGSAGTLRLQLE